MNPLLDVVESLLTIPLVVTQGVANQIIQIQREQADAFTRLMGSVAAHEGLSYGRRMHAPRHTDLFVGKSVSLSKTLTDFHTLFFGFLSLDFNPLHFNEDLARRTRFEGRIVHGMHTASLFSGVLAELTPWCVYLHQEMDFIAPVFPGETITARGTIEEIDPKGVIQVSLVCQNKTQEVVVRGRAVVKKLKEAYPPASAEG